ncbi:MAG: Ca-activated chloride channel [Thermoleophilaceae bacterium]|nr:Ca-activated chloride channel [Thermoleophilaceae bacterium]
MRFPAAPSLALAAEGTRSWRPYVPPLLALAAIASLVLALAKPQTTVAVPVDRASIMLVTDHSRSMLATDVDPNRLRAAQSAARTFLDALPGPVRVGAVAYSDTPDAVQSPSENHDDARRVVDAQVADGGTATGDALQVALDTLGQERTALQRRGEQLPAAMVLLSDGKTTIGRDPIEVARIAARLKIPIFTIALGTSDAMVPNPGLGPPLPAPPDPQTMAEIARASGGQSFRAEDELRLQSIYKALGSRLGTKKEQREAPVPFALGGLVLLLGAAGSSVALGGRVP